jgi:hypothetical protein
MHLVPSKGLEPPHPCEYMDLNHARLPIPPRWQVTLHSSGDQRSPCQEDLPVYFTDTPQPVKPAIEVTSPSVCEVLSGDSRPRLSSRAGDST